jgi:hypothetical protein
MPVAEQLPETIRDFAYRNGFELSNTRWESDVREMIRRLGLGAPPVPSSQPKNKLLVAWILIPGLVVAGVGGGLLWFHNPQSPPVTVTVSGGQSAVGVGQAGRLSGGPERLVASGPTALTRSADGYVALGPFDRNAKTYPNFGLVAGIFDESGAKAGDIIKANLPVTLRSNLENTQSGNNPSLGEIAQGDCVKILARHDNIRGQTWAEVKREKCG